MNTLITLVIWLVVIFGLVYAEGYLPIDGRLVRLIQAVTAIIGMLLVAQRFLV